MLALARSSDREKKRARERTARRRRAVNLEEMRRERDALECALLVSQTFDEFDAVWDDFLDPHVARVRHFLRQSVKLATETSSLERERAVLIQLLEEHRLASESLAEILRDHPTDDWHVKAAQWRALARSVFRPWTLDDCKAEMDKALKQASTFDWSLEKETTGFSFMGWREQRRVDRARDAFQFQFYKTYHGYEMMDFVNVGWDMYTEPRTFSDVIIGHGVQCFHEVLQQLGPNTVIVWAVARRDHVGNDVHMTFLVGRVPTERGILQCVWSIRCPELVQAVVGPADVWTSTFLWKQWTRLAGGDTSYTYRLGGSIVGKDEIYLKHWMLSIFGCVLRSERLATGRQLLTSDDAPP